MSDNDSPKTQQSTGILQNPQILATLITSLVAIIVAVIGLVPTLIEASKQPTLPPTFTPTDNPTAIPATTVPTEAISANIATVIPATVPTDMPASLPTATQEPSVETSQPNVLLMYDDVSFTLINQSSAALSLVGVAFTSDTGQWDSRDWGATLYDRLPANNCLRLRDATTGPRNPPRECGNLFGLIQAGARALFWLNTSQFNVTLNGNIITTCSTNAGSCPIVIPQD